MPHCWNTPLIILFFTLGYNTAVKLLVVFRMAGGGGLDLPTGLVRRTIDNLQNYCLGSSRGKSRLLRWLSRWLHSHLHGENDVDKRLHSSSVVPSEVAAVCLVVFNLDLSFVPFDDADWRPLVGFGPTNRRSKNRGLGLSAQRCRRHPSLRSPSSRALPC